MSSFTLRSAAALSGALLLTGLTVTTAAAAGEETASITYRCYNNSIDVPVTLAVDAPPATLVAGQKAPLATTSTVTLGPLATNILKNTLGYDHFDGTAISTGTNGTPFDLTIDTTPVGNYDGPGAGTNDSTQATPHGTTNLRPTSAGTYTLMAGDFIAHMNGYDASNASKGSLDIDCVAPADDTTTLKDSGGNPATVTVTKDASTTTASATYKAAKHEVHGKAKIGSKYGLKGVGDKVKFVLYKKTTVVAHKGGTVSKKGVAKVVFKHVKKHGHYKLVAKFPGDSGLKKSSGTAKFTIS